MVMAKVLLIDACVRGALSRTRRLADAFMEQYALRHPEAETKTLRLEELGLAPLTGETLAARQALIEAGELGEPLFAPAHAFQKADLIVVAAPYWDYLFPASLKTFIEHVCVRTLTFDYVDDRPAGLCRAEKLVFLTTAGGFIGDHDWGYGYLCAVAGELLGVKSFDRIACEGLDIAGNDPEALLEEARVRAAALARSL